MKKLELWLIALLLINGLSIAHANHHDNGEATHDKKCEGMIKDDFSISYLDANKDGVITKQEYLDGDANNQEKTFKHIDANNDGQLDLAEQQEIEAVYKDIHREYKAKTTTI